MPEEREILQDADERRRAVEEVRQLRSVVASAIRQLTDAKQRSMGATPGSEEERLSLREATETHERLAMLQSRQSALEQILRRTAYLLDLLSE